MQGEAVCEQREQQQAAFSTAHAFATGAGGGFAEHALAPEQDADAGIKRGGKQMK